MKNYQKLQYARYYAQDDSGDYIPVTRKECFAPGELPTDDNPYQQRWFYDHEAGYAVRLARNQASDTLTKRNKADLKKEERQRDKMQCAYKNTEHCGHNCQSCTNERTRRTISLDTHFGSDSDSTGFELANEADIQTLVEDKLVLEALQAALDRLTDDGRSLLHDIYWDERTERELAPLLGLKEPKSVNKRKHKALATLREEMKNYL